MRPRTVLDWVAFVLLLIGAFAWGAFVTDINVLDRVLEPIADPLDDVVFGVYAWVVAWDQDSGRHVYLNNADVAFSSAGIVQVGGRYRVDPAALETFVRPLTHDKGVHP